MSKIYTLSCAEDIIEFTANLICQEQQKDLSNLSSVAVVFPGKRPSFYLRKALAKRLNRAYFPPAIFSIEEFIQYLAAKKNPENRQVSLLDASFLIHKIIRELNLEQLNWQKELEFSQFFLWGKKIFEFIEDLDKELVLDKQLLNLQANAQIGLDVPDYVNRLLSNIVELRQRFHLGLTENRLTSPGFDYYQVTGAIDEIPLDEFKKIYFTGFFALTEAEKKIIKFLFDKDKAILIFQKDQDSWPILKDLEGFFGFGQRIEGSLALPKIEIYECLDTHSQVNACQEVLLGLPDLDSTCIVLPQVSALMPLLFEAITNLSVDYNISLGYPLKRTPLWALLEAIMQANERKRRNGNFYAQDYLKVMMHPYIKNIEYGKIKAQALRILIHKIEEMLLGQDKDIVFAGARAFLNLEDIERQALVFKKVADSLIHIGLEDISADKLKEVLRLLHNQLFFCFEQPKALDEFCGLVEDLLSFILQNSQVCAYIFSGEIFQRFFGILKEIKLTQFSKDITMEETDFFELLRYYVNFQNIPFLGTPLKQALQILGVLETRNLRFDNVIILDLNEGIFPTNVKADSLVPEGIFPSLGLTHYQKKEEIFRYHFRRLILGAKSVFLFYQKSGQNRESRSRFIEELIWEKEKQRNHLWDERKEIMRHEFPIGVTRIPLSFAKGSLTLEILKKMVFSASGIDTYLNCPAKFYFQYVLRLQEKEEISEDIEAKEVGNFFHELLAEFYSRFLGNPCRLDEKAREYLEELKERKFKAFFGEAQREYFLLKGIIDTKIDLFFKREAQRKEEIKILGLEKQFKARFGRFWLKGKIDRIDERRDGGAKRIVVVDYKTGEYKLPRLNKLQNESISERKGIKEAIQSFQLPLYIYLFQQSYKQKAKINANFYSLKELKEESLGSGDESCKMQEVFLSCLRQILEEILCADIPFLADDSDDYYCHYCPYLVLCRR